jgi:hypothetical protein
VVSNRNVCHPAVVLSATSGGHHGFAFGDVDESGHAVDLIVSLHTSFWVILSTSMQTLVDSPTRVTRPVKK